MTVVSLREIYVERNKESNNACGKIYESIKLALQKFVPYSQPTEGAKAWFIFSVPAKGAMFLKGRESALNKKLKRFTTTTFICTLLN